ncbi:hypothetical protein CEXT_172241 [Caerostris extrusa]|uniref:Uncharacterized protein n=1 Tax=Caerostris extrusa TaxID=172846 RepID=A0AAV4X8F6_CAEEX|nr:hypothetical protein CEXT_172241 [Caerostris extrusa]
MKQRPGASEPKMTGAQKRRLQIKSKQKSDEMLIVAPLTYLGTLSSFRIRLTDIKRVLMTVEVGEFVPRPANNI